MSSDGIEISVSDPLPLPLPDAEEPEAALVAGGSPPGDADVPPPERPDDADGHIDIGASGTYRERKDSYRRSLNDGTIKSVDPCEFRGSIRSIVQEGDEKDRGFLHKAFTCLTKGGTSFDSFLLAASQVRGEGRGGPSREYAGPQSKPLSLRFRLSREAASLSGNFWDLQAEFV